MVINESVLRSLFPVLSNPQDFVEPLNYTFGQFEINTKPRIAAFLAQTGHESNRFRSLTENLNYSTNGLLGTFPRYFASKEIAETYARKPERIANRVYGNRMGNGPEASGDGWKFRGRGLIQLTGKNNYLGFSNHIGISLDEAVLYLETIEGACMGAGWFWHTNDLNSYADSGDFLGLTKRINGGTKGLADRELLHESAKKLI